MIIENTIQGRVWKYGDGVNTDVIFPGKYTYTISDSAQMAQYALEDLDPTFASNVQAGDVIVAGKNWGNGSSREQAVTCLKQAGVGAVIAVSFARIWYRNAINNGLLAITCPEAVAALNKGDTVRIDLTQNLILVNDQQIPFPPLAESVQDIITAGGLIPHLKQEVRRLSGRFRATQNCILN
ncbi:3-isopropylmalate dehydratase small subunit [Anaerolineales bacterium HSG6]|nr:3-isopropylmalate dehydratase small subunit [Anaerolineales bacterium HSG6]